MIRHRIEGTRREVRKFGFLFAGIAALVAGYLVYKGSAGWVWPGALGVFFLVSGLFLFRLLRPVYIGWMKFAQLLAWVNTRILLSLAFYLVMTPVGLLLRLTGKDLLDQKINNDAETYWKKREQKNFDRSRYEHLY